MTKKFLNILGNIKKYIYNNILNIISFFILCIILYIFFIVLSFDNDWLGLIISFLISFFLSNFMHNNFKYSNNIYARFIEKFLIYTITFFLIIIIFINLLSWFDLIPTAHCCSGDEGNIIDKVKDVVKVTSETNSKNEEYYNFKLSKQISGK